MTPRPERRRGKTLALLFLAGALPCCASVSVAPGHAAVLLTPEGKMAVLGEGTTDVPSGSVVDDFDLRQQALTATFTAITKDAVPLHLSDAAVNYHVVAADLVAADRALSPADQRTLVAAVVEASAASVLATYRFDQLDTPRIREAQERITAISSARLLPYHLALASVELKGILPHLPGLANQVARTSIWEQRSAEARTRVELARQKADRLQKEAAGTASAFQTVAPTLSAAVLAEQEANAWKRLVTAPTTTVQVTDKQPLLEEAP
jgi:hypothetical protein